MSLLYLIDGVHPVLRKSKFCDPLNHKHEVRGIGQPPLPILHSKPQLVPNKLRDIKLVPT
jgi:hypothetical protein